MTLEELKAAIVKAWPKEVEDRYDLGDPITTSIESCCGIGDAYSAYPEKVDIGAVFAVLAERGRVICTSTQNQKAYAEALKQFGFRKCGPRSKNRYHGDNYIQLWDLTYEEFRKKWKLPPIRKVPLEEGKDW